MIKKTALIISMILLLLSVSNLNAMTESVSSLIKDKLIIEFYKDDLFLSLEKDGNLIEIDLECDQTDIVNNTIQFGNNIKFTSSGIIWDETIIEYNRLKRVETEFLSKGHVRMIFRIKDSQSKSRVPSDIYTAFESIKIDSSGFVRGDAICVGGNIEIDGEVSKSVICLYGDITLNAGSVVRGDVIALCGRVFRQPDSQIYGQIISKKGWRKGGRLWSFKRKYYQSLSLGAGIDYNRVDGLYLAVKYKFDYPSYPLPSAEASIGYAFEAERLRYSFEINQRIFDRFALEPYGKVYRRTETEDDWIIGTTENMIFTILVHEDFRDYYEREGSELGIKFHLGHQNSIDLNYSYNSLRWMDAHPKLWSLLGSKDFRSNFSSVPHDERQTYRDDLESKLSLFTAKYTFDSRPVRSYTREGWIGEAMLEKAGGNLEGDLTYTRWIVSLIRYQPLFDPILSLRLRAVYGGSDENVPLFKKFFLGGMNTLRGYNHKRFYGDQMFLVNAEYMVEVSNPFSIGVFYDIGNVVGQKENIFSDGEYKSDVGIMIGIDPVFKLELAKALDNSESDIKLWVSFSKSF